MRAEITQKIKSAPKSPGVYLFYKNHHPLYIGKAANLRLRLNSYLKPTDIKTTILNKEADYIKLIKCQSPIAALIEESRQIKQLQPRLNVYWRDDKQYFYVAFTEESFPKVFITHHPQFEIRNSKLEINNIGPFTDGHALRLILRIIRRRYFYCTCKESHLRQCLNSQIGLCFGFCCARPYPPASEIAKNHISKRSLAYTITKKYQKNIKTIKSILSGGNKKLLERITKPSDRWAAENIFSHSQYLVEPQSKNLSKIECYDVSNLSGKEAVGAMTVLVNNNGKWEVDKNQFRKFRIKTLTTRDDPKMIAEIVGRRLRHTEWPFPDLIIIDGGKTQYNAAKKVTGDLKVIGFAKPNRQIIGTIDNLPAKQIIERAIKQTHKFAINYHRKLREKPLN